MPARVVKIKWNGDLIKSKVRAGENIALAEVGKRSVSTCQSIVPQDTGRLHDSIEYHLFEAGRGWVMMFGSFADDEGIVEYAGYVEIGTTKMSAQPYIRPTVDLEFESIGEELQRWIS